MECCSVGFAFYASFGALKWYFSTHWHTFPAECSVGHAIHCLANASSESVFALISAWDSQKGFRPNVDGPSDCSGGMSRNVEHAFWPDAQGRHACLDHRSGRATVKKHGEHGSGAVP